MQAHKDTTYTPIHKKYLFSFLVATITTLLLYSIFGFYWEGSMTTHPAIAYAQICAPPYELWFSESFLFHPPIIAYLASIFETIPLLGVWHFVLLIFYVSITLHLILRIVSRAIATRTIFIVSFSVLITLGILGTSLMYIHLGREAILLSAMSAFLYIDYVVEDNHRPRFFVFTFFLGCLMRASLGLFTLSAISILLWLHYRSLQKVYQYLLWQWLIAILCFAIVLIYKFTVNNPGVVIEQNYEYALMDRGAVLPISTMKTKTDSLRYDALTKFFLITDSQYIDINFIHQVTDTKKFYKIGCNANDFHHMIDALSPLLNTYKTTILLLYLMLLVLGWGCNKRTSQTLFFFHMFCWSVICLLSMKINMYERFLLPWMVLMFLGSFLFISFQNKPLYKVRGYLFLGLSLSLLSFEFKQMSRISSVERGFNYKTSLYLQNIKQLSNTNTPIIWDYTQHYFPSQLFTRLEGNVLKGSLYQTMFLLAYFPFGQERFIHNFGVSPLDWKSTGRKYIENRRNFVFIMEEPLAEFLPRYYHTMYNIDFTLEKSTPINEISPNYYVYQLKLK